MSESVTERPLNRMGDHRGNFNWNKDTGGPWAGGHLAEVHRLKISAQVRRTGIRKLDAKYGRTREQKLAELRKIEDRIAELESADDVDDKRQDSKPIEK